MSARPASPPQSGSRSRRFSRLRRLGPWALGLAILTFLVARLDLTEILRALRRGPVAPIAGLVAGIVVVTLVLDAWATRVSFQAGGTTLELRPLLVVRGITYLPGTVHPLVGQSGLILYLRCRGASLSHAIGQILFLWVMQILALLTAVLVGLPTAPVPAELRVALGLLALTVPGYFLLLPVLQRHVRRRRSTATIAEPLAHAGLGAQLAVLGARLVHVAALLLGQWVALRAWGVEIPLAAGWTLVGIVLLVAALPISPAGIGTSQAAQVLLLAPFAQGATADERGATVLAFGIAYHALGLAGQMLIGLICLRLFADEREAGCGS